jgi:hypothetical protein
VGDDPIRPTGDDVSDTPVIAKTAHLVDGEILIDGKPIPWHVATEVRYVEVWPAKGKCPPLYELHLRVIVKSEPTMSDRVDAAAVRSVDVDYGRSKSFDPNDETT